MLVDVKKVSEYVLVVILLWFVKLIGSNLHQLLSVSWCRQVADKKSNFIAFTTSHRGTFVTESWVQWLVQTYLLQILVRYIPHCSPVVAVVGRITFAVAIVKVNRTGEGNRISLWWIGLRWSVGVYCPNDVSMRLFHRLCLRDSLDNYYDCRKNVCVTDSGIDITSYVISSTDLLLGVAYARVTHTHSGLPPKIRHKSYDNFSRILALNLKLKGQMRTWQRRTTTR